MRKIKVGSTQFADYWPVRYSWLLGMQALNHILKSKSCLKKNKNIKPAINVIMAFGVVQPDDYCTKAYREAQKQMQKLTEALEGKWRLHIEGSRCQPRDWQHQVQEILLPGDYWDGDTWNSSNKEWTERSEDEKRKSFST